jgi:hypothetical protein
MQDEVEAGGRPGLVSVANAHLAGIRTASSKLAACFRELLRGSNSQAAAWQKASNAGPTPKPHPLQTGKWAEGFAGAGQRRTEI